MLKKSNKNKLNNNIIKGFPNLGNTCYSSVMLQLLFSCSDIIKIIDSCNQDLLFSNNQMSTLKSLIKDYFYSNSNLVDRETLKIFYKSLQCPLSQQDSAEYLRSLLDIISMSDCKDIYELIGIDILTKDTYSNKKISKLTRYSILDIPIPQNLQKYEYDFETDLWNPYFNTEELIASTKNKKGNDIIFNRDIILSCNPKYFFINIKRYEYNINASKINNNVNNIWMKKKIIIDKYNPTRKFTPSDSSSTDKNPLIYNGKLCITYKLIAFGVHLGRTIKGGHWISFKLINNEWFYCSDIIIEKKSKKFIKDYLKKASLLLYEKTEESKRNINCKNNNKNIDINNQNNNENETNKKNEKNHFNKYKIEERDKYNVEYKKKIVKSVSKLLTDKIKENMIEKGFNPHSKTDIFNYKWHRNIKLNNDNLEGMKLLKLNPVKRINYIKFKKYKNTQFKKLENIKKEFEKKLNFKKTFTNKNIEEMKSMHLNSNNLNNLLTFKEIKKVQYK